MPPSEGNDSMIKTDPDCNIIREIIELLKRNWNGTVHSELNTSMKGQVDGWILVGRQWILSNGIVSAEMRQTSKKRRDLFLHQKLELISEPLFREENAPFCEADFWSPRDSPERPGLDQTTTRLRYDTTCPRATSHRFFLSRCFGQKRKVKQQKTSSRHQVRLLTIPTVLLRKVHNRYLFLWSQQCLL